MADVQLQFAAILIEIQERRESLEEERVHGEGWRCLQFKAEQQQFYTSLLFFISPESKYCGTINSMRLKKDSLVKGATVAVINVWEA